MNYQTVPNLTDPMLLLPISLIFTLATGLFWILTFSILYHLIRFGIGTMPKQIAFFYFCGCIVLNIVSTLLFMGIFL
jgi:hypothetical protein